MTDQALPQEELVTEPEDGMEGTDSPEGQQSPEAEKNDGANPSEDGEAAQSGMDNMSPDDASDGDLVDSIDSMDGVSDSVESSFADIGGSFSEDAAAGVTEAKSANFRQLNNAGRASGPQNLDMLLDVDLPVSIELGRTTMSIQEILNLSPGSVVELDKLAGEPVDLLVNNKAVAKGEVVVIDENFGLRVTSLISTDERLKSLGA
ncbi:MAG: flagellar motor switch protein FliN [candidate division Zixibacteria bacterium]|nr:flagellar motor switch protein FliN [candidate division Zixibacteria bacterium]